MKSEDKQLFDHIRLNSKIYSDNFHFIIDALGHLLKVPGQRILEFRYSKKLPIGDCTFDEEVQNFLILEFMKRGDLVRLFLRTMNLKKLEIS